MPEHPWCTSVERVCECFGTVGPSTLMRDPAFDTWPVENGRCEKFIEDGGHSRTLREARGGN
jgi:hypothetical protein